MGTVAKPGEPRREITVEPISVPEPEKAPSTPAPVPEREPEKVPA